MTQLASRTYSIGSWQANSVDTAGVAWGVIPQGSTHFNGPGVRLNQTPKPYGPGGYRIRSYRDIRVITLQGWAKAPDVLSALKAQDTLRGLFPAGGQQTLTIADTAGTRSMSVELGDAVKITPAKATPTYFDWQLTLSAVDPRFYDITVQSLSTGLPTASGGLDWSTGGGLNWSTGGGLNWGTAGPPGTVIATNTGNAETWPTITFTGPFGNPTVTAGNGLVMTYAGILATGDTVVLNCSPYARSVLLNGVDQRANLIPAMWMSLPANSSLSFTLSATSGTGQMTVSWQNASW